MKKRVLSLALALMMCLGLAVPALAAYEMEIEGLTFELSNDPIEVIGWKCATGWDDNWQPTGYRTEKLYIVPDNTTVICKTYPNSIIDGVKGSDWYDGFEQSGFDATANAGEPLVITPYIYYGGDDGFPCIFNIDGIYDPASEWGQRFEDNKTYFMAASALAELEPQIGFRLERSNGSGTTPAPETPAPTAPSTGFTDVAVDAYYAAPVTWAVEKGITKGTDDVAKKFSPGQNCTNAQILTFLWRAYGQPEPTIGNPFTNTIPDAYTKAVVWAYEKGMVSGTTFDVDKPCTRAMAVTYMWQAAGSPTPSVTATFTDVPAGSSYASAVAWAVEKEITKGTNPEGTMFSPDEICNRGQIVTFLHRNLA